MKLSYVQAVVLMVLVGLFGPAAVMAAGHGDFGCDGCHTPHHALTLEGVPLWSGGEPNTATFELYSSATLQAVPGQPDGASKLCLSCHDGANPDYSWMGSDLIIDDLPSTHPISFVYDSGLASADGYLKDPSEDSTLGGSIFEDLLHSIGKMQCNSCHDVHSSGVGDNLLRGYDYGPGPGGSELCRMCHIR
jgi:predicted CXXCH cytochrome family protein